MSNEQSGERSYYTRPMAGDVLAGKYRIEQIIGRGGMAIVVAATHLKLEQRVAIKYLLRPDNEEIVARFLREARANARLRSEHVVRVTDVGTFDNGLPFMIMEYLDGIDLLKYLNRHGPLPVDEAIDYVLQTCEAIAEAHAQGIIHRDLKPANLFLTTTPDESTCVKVLDFGISKVSDDQTKGPDGMQLTNTATVLGTAYYMSPEQHKSTRDVDARGDIWSLGVILYQLLAGKVPFPGQSAFQVGLKATYEQPPPLTTTRRDVSTELEAVILTCLEKKPEDRFNDVAELALSLAPFGPPTARASAEKTKRVLDAPPPSRRGDEGTFGPASKRGGTPNQVHEPPRPEVLVEQEVIAAPPPVVDTQSNAATVPLPTIATRPQARTKLIVGTAFAVLLVGGAGITVLRSISTPPDEPRTGTESAHALGDKPVRTAEPAAVTPASPSASSSTVANAPARNAKTSTKADTAKVDTPKVDATTPSTTSTKTNSAKNPLKEVGIE